MTDHRSLIRPLSLLAITLLVSGVWAQAPAGNAAPNAKSPRALAAEPWQDRAYGISLRLPVDTAVRAQTADDFLVRCADDQGLFTMALSVKRSNSQLTLAQVAKSARKQILSVQGTSEVLEERPATLMERPAVVIHARIPLVTGGQQLLSQAIVQMDPQTFAVFESRSNLNDRPKVQPIFEAVIETMAMTDPDVLDEQRKAALNAGHEWRTRVGLKELEAALVPEQLFRLTRDGNDVGYVRMRQRRTNREGFTGFEVQVQTRIVDGADHIDSLAEFFLADNDQAEFWTITTTKRPAAERPAPARPGTPSNTVTYVETGIRTGKQILITTQGPQGEDKQELARPPVGYLSQVEAMLLPQILPIDRPVTYGFYSYNARVGKLTFRTDQITPALTGFTLTTRLTPNDTDIRSTYAADRRLVRKQLGPNEQQLPTTAQELQQIWTRRGLPGTLPGR